MIETLMDELAERAGRDPVEFRLAHLSADDRARAVLDQNLSDVLDQVDGGYRWSVEFAARDAQTLADALREAVRTEQRVVEMARLLKVL